MNAQKVQELREKLRERINVAIENGIVFGGDIDEIESICRALEQARKEPMPCKSCGLAPVLKRQPVTGKYQYVCCLCGPISESQHEAIEAWDKEQQQ